jgi:phosphoribosylamine-glycine ligase
MKLMVVGGGGREHAIIRSLKKNPEVTEIFALPGNGGIASDATCVPIGATDIDGIVNFAVENAIDYAVVAPDDPLVLGCVDRLNEKGIPCFGPRANAAIIEGSKAFAKNLMKKYGIPTAAYEIFSDLEAALAYLETAPIPTVIKADGLALGKGVIIAQTREEAKEAVDKKFEDFEKDFDEKLSKVEAVAQYEVFSKPEGTLVSLKQDEIRVMCPKDTAWVKQANGADANKYYIGLKIYAPNDKIHSFKEDIKEFIDD